MARVLGQPQKAAFIFLVGLPGIEPGLHAPHACVLPVYYSPITADGYYSKNENKKTAAGRKSLFDY